MRNNTSSKLTSYFLVILSIVAISYSFVKQMNIDNKEQITPEQIQKQIKDTLEESKNKPSDYPDYESLKTLTKLTLAKDFESWTPGSKKQTSKIIETVVLDKGELSKGYVYLKASVDGIAALTQWESLYMTMNYRGGHIFRPQSLAIPGSDKTELLYALNDIPYLTAAPYNEQSLPARTNWFGLFTNSNRILVTSFISSLRRATIEELSIYYSCKVDNDCSLSKLN